MMQESLARRLRVLRAQRGLTLLEAAEMTGVGRDTLSDLERGRRHPVMPTLTKIAEGYGVPVEDLLEEPVLAGKAEAPGEAGRAEAEERGEDTEYVHFSTVLGRIGGAGNAAREVVREWRSESARILGEGRPPGKHRAMEMRSFHNELSVIYTTSINLILKGVKEGLISVGRSSDEPQDLAEDPSLWPRELRDLIYDAGSHIAVLPAVIESLEREWAARGLESAAFATQRSSIAEGSLPSEIVEEAGWRDAVERARKEAGIR